MAIIQRSAGYSGTPLPQKLGIKPDHDAPGKPHRPTA